MIAGPWERWLARSHGEHDLGSVTIEASELVLEQCAKPGKSGAVLGRDECQPRLLGGGQRAVVEHDDAAMRALPAQRADVGAHDAASEQAVGLA